MQYWRTKCNFDAYEGKAHVEGRVHFELAETAEEATAMSIAYLKICHYTNIEVTDCHAETEEEKYGKKLPKLEEVQAEKEAPSVKDEIPKPAAAKQAGAEFTDDLF